MRTQQATGIRGPLGNLQSLTKIGELHLVSRPAGRLWLSARIRPLLHDRVQ
jgi:hypothetical protein